MSNQMNAPLNTELRSDIKSALNRASAENPSGTPDHILADYLLGCLEAFDRAVLARATWRDESTNLPALDKLCAEIGDPDTTPDLGNGENA